MQHMVIKILTPFGKLVSGITSKTRNIVSTICMVLLFCLYFINNTGLYTGRYIYTFIVGCVLLGIMTLMFIREDLKPVKWSKPLAICWFGAGGLMFISGIVYNTDYLSNAILFLLVFPIIFIIWNNCGTEKLFKILINGCIISFLFVLAVNVIFFPAAEKQYSGLFTNVNGAASYYTLVFACILAEIFYMEKLSAKYFTLLVLAGLCGALIFYTNSRTGEYATIIMFVLSAILYLIVNRTSWKVILLRNVVPVIVAVAVFIPTSIYLFQIRPMIENAVKSEEVIVDNGEPNIVDSAKPEQDFGIGGYVETNETKTEITGKDADTILTGRLSIWKEYAKRLTLFGNSGDEEIYVPSRERIYTTSHMTILQFAYQSGIICGLFYLAYNILGGLKSIKYGVKNKSNKYALFPFIVTIGFGVGSLAESLTTSFLHIIIIYYYFLQTPLIIAIGQKESL